MKNLLVRLAASSLILLLALALPAAQKANTQKTQEAKKQLDQAEARLKESRSAVSQAQKEVTQADTAQQTAAAALAKARQTLYDRHAGKLGLTAAAAERDAARIQVNAARKTLQADLKTQPDYQTAAKSADESGERFRGLNDNKTLTSEQRQKLSIELAVAMRRPAELEREREASDPKFQEATARFKAAEQKVAALQAKLQQEMDADPVVKDAQEKAKAAVSHATKARTALNQAQQQMNSAQATEQREQQQYQQAQNQGNKSNRKRKN